MDFDNRKFKSHSGAICSVCACAKAFPNMHKFLAEHLKTAVAVAGGWQAAVAVHEQRCLHGPLVINDVGATNFI